MPADRLTRFGPLRAPLMATAQGCWYTDTEGRRYLDLLAGCWCTVLGHGHPEFVERVRQQVERFIHAGTGYLSREIEAGVDALLALVPQTRYRVAVLNTGSEAVDLAVRVARAATGRRAVVSLHRGYYGATAEMLSLTGPPGPHPGGYRLPAPDCHRCPVRLSPSACECACLEASDLPAEIAAVICEPVMVSGGMLVPPPGYLARLAAMARERGGLLVVNEVTTGGGRTGRWFAHQGQGIRPDLLTLGKAFGNGFPVAAVLVREQVEERAHEAGLTHVQSHGFDPFSGFLLATVIELVRAENLLHRASETGHRLRTYLEGVTERFPVTNVRGDGMLLAFDLDPNHVDFDAVARRLEDLRIVVAAQPAYHTIRLLPALVLGEEEIDTFTAGLETALRDST